MYNYSFAVMIIMESFLELWCKCCSQCLKFKNTKGVPQKRKSGKDTQYNGQQKKSKRTNNDLHKQLKIEEHGPTNLVDKFIIWNEPDMLQFAQKMEKNCTCTYLHSASQFASAVEITKIDAKHIILNWLL